MTMTEFIETIEKIKQEKGIEYFRSENNGVKIGNINVTANKHYNNAYIDWFILADSEKYGFYIRQWTETLIEEIFKEDENHISKLEDIGLKNDLVKNKSSKNAIFIVSYSFWFEKGDKGSVFPAHIVIKHKIPKTEDDFEKFMEDVMKKVLESNMSVNNDNFLGINSISRFDIED